jgi:hypothetical protein
MSKVAPAALWDWQLSLLLLLVLLLVTLGRQVLPCSAAAAYAQAARFACSMGSIYIMFIAVINHFKLSARHATSRR